MAEPAAADGERFPAPAKINLFLHVVGRRADGLHELQTVFQFLDHGDSLAFETRADGAVRRVGGDGLPAEDLTVRAAKRLKERTGCRLGVDVHLDKRLPVGAGLGGGSSDAASVLIGLDRLWGLDLGRDELAAIGLELGADVPLFVHGRAAWGEGVGDRLTALEPARPWYVVVVPPVTVETARVFADPQLTRDTPRIKIRDFPEHPVRNDLEPVTCRLYPAVGHWLEWLRGFGPARMTGSGGAVFLAAPDRAQAERILDRRPDGCDGFVARGVNLHPLAERSEISDGV
jgi:4-diphosphocytidyl-2-C-methyl-D-erythritol kinase